MANPSVTYTFTNGTVADATQMNQNWTDIINCLTDGSKSLNIDAITTAGKATLNGAVDLGNATGDTITVNGLFAGTGGDASDTQKGLVTTGAQSFAGVKTFTSTIVGGVSGNAGTVTNGVYTTGNQSIAGVKTFTDALAAGAALSVGTTITQTNGILKTNYTTESSGQIETSTQFVLAQTASKGLTISVNAGLVFVCSANTGESALIFIGATNLIISQSVPGKWSLAAGTDHRFEFNNANKVATITRNAAGSNTYQLITLGCQG